MKEIIKKERKKKYWYQQYSGFFRSLMALSLSTTTMKTTRVQLKPLTFGGDVDGGGDVGQEVGHKAVVQAVVVGPDTADGQQTFVARCDTPHCHLQTYTAHLLQITFQELKMSHSHCLYQGGNEYIQLQVEV